MIGRKRALAESLQTRRLVSATTEKLRQLILALPPDAMIGSLPEVAKALDVGTVTVQQAARVLEHEGLLAVRRGPGGGYFGKRPDSLALERALASYLRARHADNYEALEIMTLLDCELMPAAAHCKNAQHTDELRRLKTQIDSCVTADQRTIFEDSLHAVLFKMVNRPLIELLAQVSMQFYRSRPIPQIFEGESGIRAWRQWRHLVIDAILAHDPPRARFEAQRHRERLLRKLAQSRGAIDPRHRDTDDVNDPFSELESF
jgi:GntR family transcriptional regulator, transcriptional repressor for pyruvate dehydrogenase complex